jgi:hypothetical protein
MSAGITRVNGSAEVGTSRNVTGRKSTFFGGYQPLFVKIQTVTATAPFATTTVNGTFTSLISACETVGTVVGYGNPSTTDTASSTTAVVIFDAGSVNQGSGVGGQEVNGSPAQTGFGALKTAIVGVFASYGVTVVASDIAITTYTGFAGASLAA